MHVTFIPLVSAFIAFQASYDAWLKDTCYWRVGGACSPSTFPALRIATHFADEVLTYSRVRAGAQQRRTRRHLLSCRVSFNARSQSLTRCLAMGFGKPWRNARYVSVAQSLVMGFPIGGQRPACFMYVAQREFVWLKQQVWRVRLPRT